MFESFISTPLYFLNDQAVLAYCRFMENLEIKNYIANLGGRRAYEEKRAAKLGFSNLYDYMEYKFAKKAEVLVEQENTLSKLKSQRAIPKPPKQSQNKSCSCC